MITAIPYFIWAKYEGSKIVDMLKNINVPKEDRRHPTNYLIRSFNTHKSYHIMFLACEVFNVIVLSGLLVAILCAFQLDYFPYVTKCEFGEKYGSAGVREVQTYTCYLYMSYVNWHLSFFAAIWLSIAIAVSIISSMKNMLATCCRCIR